MKLCTSENTKVATNVDHRGVSLTTVISMCYQ